MDAIIRSGNWSGRKSVRVRVWARVIGLLLNGTVGFTLRKRVLNLIRPDSIF